MKILYTIIFTICASSCFAHGGWKPMEFPPMQTYPEVVVPVQPVQTLTTFVTPRVYYMWTPYYVVEPVRPRHFTLFPRLHTTYQPTIQWSLQPYYSY